MVVNRGRYQIAQFTGEDTVKIYRVGEGKPMKILAAKEGLSVYELEKILELYVGPEVNDESH